MFGHVGQMFGHVGQYSARRSVLGLDQYSAWISTRPAVVLGLQ